MSGSDFIVGWSGLQTICTVSRRSGLAIILIRPELLCTFIELPRLPSAPANTYVYTSALSLLTCMRMCAYLNCRVWRSFVVERADSSPPIFLHYGRTSVRHTHTHTASCPHWKFRNVRLLLATYIDMNIYYCAYWTRTEWFVSHLAGGRLPIPRRSSVCFSVPSTTVGPRLAGRARSCTVPSVLPYIHKYIFCEPNRIQWTFRRLCNYILTCLASLFTTLVATRRPDTRAAEVADRNP